MYNGIGLQTARGSGTNGYVQKNMSFVNHKPKVDYKSFDEMKPAVHKKPNKEILEHEAKRRVEVKLLEYRDKLEDLGLKESEIEEKVESHRARLFQELAASKGSALAQGASASDTHGRAAAKEAEMERVRGAWGISSDHVEGESFDPEAQQRRKEERKERQHREYEQRQVVRDKREQEMRERQERGLAEGGARRESRDDRGGGRRDRSSSRDRRRRSSRSPPRARHFDSDSDEGRDGDRGGSSRGNRRDEKSERSSRQRGSDRGRWSESSSSRSRSRSPRRR
jgi:serine/arginine repetitive matrix protein 2